MRLTPIHPHTHAHKLYYYDSSKLTRLITFTGPWSLSRSQRSDQCYNVTIKIMRLIKGKLSCHTLSEKCFSFSFLGPFLERAFVSLDFRRKCVKAFPFMKKISDKTSGNWDFRVRGWCCYAVMLLCLFLFVCLTSLCLVLGQAVMGLFKWI